MPDALNAVLIGCGGMGKSQARILAAHPRFCLTAVCDMNEEALQQAAAATGATPYTDVAQMLARESPATVSICTGNSSHAALTIQAALAGVRGVYCEKPMATNLKAAREMVAACRSHHAVLVINHQRRISPDLVKMRELIENDAIGPIQSLRATCAGDVLSDGTHAVDSVMFLAGDPDVDWVFGQVHRDLPQDTASSSGTPGFRYGHAVEDGATAVFALKKEAQPGMPVRAELFCGDMRDNYRAYQDYEIIGTRGRIWRTGDQATPNVFIQDARGGPWQAGLDKWTYKPVPTPNRAPGVWRPVVVPAAGESAIHNGYTKFAEMVESGTPSPMRAEMALRGFEIIMAIYESARLHQRIDLPLAQDRFPLELMIEGETP